MRAFPNTFSSVIGILLRQILCETDMIRPIKGAERGRREEREDNQPQGKCNNDRRVELLVAAEQGGERRGGEKHLRWN